MILADCVAAGFCPVEAQPECVSLVIIDRIPVFARLRVPPGCWTIMMSAPHQVMKTERSHVVDRGLMRSEHQPDNRCDCTCVIRERHSGPLRCNLIGRYLRVPGQPAECVPVCLQQMMPCPVAI